MNGTDPQERPLAPDPQDFKSAEEYARNVEGWAREVIAQADQRNASLLTDLAQVRTDAEKVEQQLNNAVADLAQAEEQLDVERTNARMYLESYQEAQAKIRDLEGQAKQLIANGEAMGAELEEAKSHKEGAKRRIKDLINEVAAWKTRWNRQAARAGMAEDQAKGLTFENSQLRGETLSLNLQLREARIRIGELEAELVLQRARKEDAEKRAKDYAEALGESLEAQGFTKQQEGIYTKVVSDDEVEAVSIREPSAPKRHSFADEVRAYVASVNEVDQPKANRTIGDALMAAFDAGIKVGRMTRRL